MAHGKSLELAQIKRPAPTVVYATAPHPTPRYKNLGGVANRRSRRAVARAAGIRMPAASLTPYRKETD